MNTKKRKRIETKGWKVGSASDFLNLTSDETAYVEMKLALSKRLREARQEKTLSQAQFAQLLKSSQSRIAKMEAGDPSVSLDLLVRSLLALGTTRKSLARFLA
jgi:ribosome-binding protein aMBF1 (putative translation factor)